MSSNNEVPPNKNNNKVISDIFNATDTMLCEDWMDYNIDDEDEDEGRHSDTVESPVVETEENPQKNERPSSLVASPIICKKRELPIFDELLLNLNFDVLNMNFTKLLLFLESTNKEVSFPFTLKEYEELFKIIVDDINILKSKSLDAQYRNVCDTIIKAATGYLLTYKFEYWDDDQKLVMVIKKEKEIILDQSENETPSLCWAKESMKLSEPKISSVFDTKLLSSRSRATISSGFKLHCLRTMVAFIKYDETKSKEFPELSPDQANYMQLLLERDLTFNDFESNSEVKELYTALWEVMDNYSLKYVFKMNYVDSWSSKKTVTFEKIPKEKSSGTAENSNQKMNPNAEPWFAKPEVPKLKPVAQKPSRLTKRMLKQQIKEENEVLLMQKIPPKFMIDTLNTILEFLMHDEKDRLVLVPKDHNEQVFIKKVFMWSRTAYDVSKFGEEFAKLHYKLSCTLDSSVIDIKETKPKTNKFNLNTGIREITYIKVPSKYKAPRPESVQSAPKMKKVNLQNVLELAGTEQIQLSSVVDLNQSLRNKKKNKKQKKEKLKKSNARASNDAKSSTDNSKSSSACSSRAESRDRAQLGSKDQQTTKRSVTENNQSARIRRGEDLNRKEQLMEALSVPVQSDKAMRMMRGMGWSGGALGLRGEGITEPIMPKLDITRGAGFGHRNFQSENTVKKPKDTKTTTCWVSEKPRGTKATSSWDSENRKVIEETENDIIVQKTKQLLLENRTFDSIVKTVEQASSSKVELPKPKVELQTQSTPNEELQKPGVLLTFRLDILHSILKLLNAVARYITLMYDNEIPKKNRKFVNTTLKIINNKNINYGLFMPNELSTYTKIQAIISQKMCHILLEALFLQGNKSIQLKKTNMPSVNGDDIPPHVQMPTDSHMPTKSEAPPQQGQTNPEVITEELVKSYIVDTNTTYGSSKAFNELKFKILFLLNILNFLKSKTEEDEVIFKKKISLKQTIYIHNVIDEINMKIRFGSSLAENKLCREIKEHIKDAFLGAMFNHQYTKVTLNKYYRFKRLNRPDHVDKRKCQTIVNLDMYKSETVTEAVTKVDTPEPTNAENNNQVAENNNVTKYLYDCSKVGENYNENAKVYNKMAENFKIEDDPYDSDGNSIDDYIDINANGNSQVSSLPLGEGVNVSDVLYFYDKKKTDTDDVKDNINNDIASKVTENIKPCYSYINDKNNVGNGNVVIDNNYKQIIDMKGDGNNKIREIRTAEKEKNAVDLSTAEYVFICDEDKVIISNNDSSENIKNIPGNRSNMDIKDTNVKIKEDAIEMMEVISIKDKEDSVKVTNKEEKWKEVVKMKEDTSFSPSDYQNEKQTNNLDSKADCDILTSKKIVLRERNCDNQSVVLKVGTNVGVPNFLNSKDSEIINVRIAHVNHPHIKYTLEKFLEIQSNISNAIVVSTELPLLKCHGIQNGALFYTCQNTKSFDWLRNTASQRYVRVLDFEVQKMALEFFCYFAYNIRYLFKMIELYNPEISTKNWVVERTEKDNNIVIYIVLMDKSSIKFIHKSGCALFAGVDKVQFSPVWE